MKNYPKSSRRCLLERSLPEPRNHLAFEESSRVSIFGRLRATQGYRKMPCLKAKVRGFNCGGVKEYQRVVGDTVRWPFVCDSGLREPHFPIQFIPGVRYCQSEVAIIEPSLAYQSL